jgi:hypothetical protein
VSREKDFWGCVKEWVHQLQELPKSSDNLLLTQLFLARAFSGIFTNSIIAPGECIKRLLQIQQGGAAPKYAGPVKKESFLCA